VDSVHGSWTSAGRGPLWTGHHGWPWKSPELGLVAASGHDVGTVGTKRRRVGGVGIFTGGGAAFYWAKARRGRPGAFNGRHQCLSLKAPVTRVKRVGRGCDCGQLMRGQVKSGKGRSLGLRGAGAREGVAPMTRVARWGGNGASAGSGCWPLDVLG
jgi:hypothetical protein